MPTFKLSWLRPHPDFDAAIDEIKRTEAVADRLRLLKAAAGFDLDSFQTGLLDREFQRLAKEAPQALRSLAPLKLAFLGSFTLDHLLPSIRVASLRRGLNVQIYTAHYNQVRQDILDPSSELHQFKPDVAVLAFHANDMGLSMPLSATEESVAYEEAMRMEEWEKLWTILKSEGVIVVHQTLAVPPRSLFGHLDATVPTTPVNLIHRLNEAVRARASKLGVLLLDMEFVASYVGARDWWDFSFWYHAKHAIPFSHATWYADHVARILAAIRGMSAKCLVLDLDNTLWGGVVGDDGVAGIELGQGNAIGEAYLAFQHYVKSLRERGVILAVCSKNADEVARTPFLQHPESVLKLDDFAVFIANWDDKATNLKRIAARLNIGLDALVFFDDNPAERAIVREFLPEVSVPEVPEDPAYYASCLVEAGYFEAVTFTGEDLQRTAQYQANAKRAEMMESNNLDEFLKGLDMKMTVAPFDEMGRARVAQLINKSNQFNLMTRRYTEPQVAAMAADPSLVTMQVRLKDKLGDNGMISVVIGRPAAHDPAGLLIDTWLMSCRVLGRGVEYEVLNALVSAAKARGCETLYGEYLPSAKNALVKDHYKKLGFEEAEFPGPNGLEGHSFWRLDLASYRPHPTFIAVDGVRRDAQPVAAATL